MMVVTEDAPGVFKVVLTDSHKVCLDAAVKAVDCDATGIMGMWIVAGVTEFAFTEADKQIKSRMSKSLDSGPDCDDT